jgi:hypothetical protein
MEKRALSLIVIIVVVAMIVVAAGLSFQSEKPSEKSPYIQNNGDYLEWSNAYVLNATLIDTDNWNNTPLFYLENHIKIDRTLLVGQNATNISLIFSSLVWERMTEEQILAVYQGIFPPLSEGDEVVWDNGTRWYAPCPDPQIYDPNYTFTELPNQTILTNWGHLDCEHYSLSYEGVWPGIPGITPDYNFTSTIEWWLYHGILIKMYASGTTDGVPDENVMRFSFLTDTNITLITDNNSA